SAHPGAPGADSSRGPDGEHVAPRTRTARPAQLRPMNTGRRRAAAGAAGVLLVALAGPASAGATEPAMPDQDPPPSTPIVEFRDVGAMGTAGRGDLVLFSDGRAWTL